MKLDTTASCHPKTKLNYITCRMILLTPCHRKEALSLLACIVGKDKVEAFADVTRHLQTAAQT